MEVATRVLRSYDHRLRELVHSSRNSNLAVKIGVPRSTASRWRKKPPRTVVSIKAHSADIETLEQEVMRLLDGSRL